jgi:hypothetical protein
MTQVELSINTLATGRTAQIHPLCTGQFKPRHPLTTLLYLHCNNFFFYDQHKLFKHIQTFCWYTPGLLVIPHSVISVEKNTVCAYMRLLYD